MKTTASLYSSMSAAAYRRFAMASTARFSLARKARTLALFAAALALLGDACGLAAWATPKITKITPDSGAIGSPVTITGSGFGTKEDTSTVKFGGAAAETIKSWSATSIVAEVPAGATTGKVVVTVDGVASNGVVFTVAPHLEKLNPAAGHVGAAVTIAGSNFGAKQGTSTVKFNGKAAAVATKWSATSISTAVPAGATTGDVVVTVDGLKSNGLPFTVAITVSVSPKAATVPENKTQTFVATVEGTSNKNVTWKVDGVKGGTTATGKVSAGGLYVAPAATGKHTIEAQSAADTAAVGTATVTVTAVTAPPLGVTTYHNDPYRDGANTQETVLTPKSVTSQGFGKLFACQIDAPAYAQPLWVGKVSIKGGTHNVLIAATAHDSVFAFDADASPCVTYWSKSLIPDTDSYAQQSDLPCGNYFSGIGIIGTPVIDPTTNVVYLVAETVTVPSGTVHSKLHALSLIDGSEKFGGPVEIAATLGNVTFEAANENQRPGLALDNGVVYVTYGGLYGDCASYHGWIIGYDASTLAQTAVFDDTPAATSDGGGMWMSGGAPAFDGASLYAMSGNGVWDGMDNFGDSFVKLSTTGKFSLTGYFTPSDQLTLADDDIDLGSGGPMLFDAATGPVQHYMAGGGKEGILYLLNRDKPGGFDSNNKGALQVLPVQGGNFSTPAFWNNTLYIAPSGIQLGAYPFDPAKGQLATSPLSQTPLSFGGRGVTVSISSNGNSDGIVWLIDPSPALRAYDATNLANELWDSTMGNNNAPGGNVEFTVPTIVNGKVYVGTATEIDVYGLTGK